MKKRNINLDLIRVVAVLSVLSVHFFFNSAFYSTVQEGKVMYVATVMRTASMVCVPLFLLLSGYLMKNKTFSKDYFFKGGLNRVLITYLISTILILLYRKWVLDLPLTLFGVGQSLLKFEHYSWYIEMYVGLYLLIPFINIAYHQLTQQQKIGLLIVLVLLTGVPVLVAYQHTAIIPSFWKELYPITYYVIGSFLSEYAQEIRIKTRYVFLLYILSIIVGGTYTYLCSYGVPFIWGSWCSWGNLFNIFSTSCLFLFLLKLQLENLPLWLTKVVTLVSTVSLPLYLISWVTDDIVYTILKQHIFVFEEQLKYMPLTVISSFIFAFLIAMIINWLCNLCQKIVHIS